MKKILITILIFIPVLVFSLVWEKIEIPVEANTLGLFENIFVDDSLLIVSGSGVKHLWVFDGIVWTNINKIVNNPSADFKMSTRKVIKGNDGFYYLIKTKNLSNFANKAILLRFKNPDEVFGFNYLNSNIEDLIYEDIIKDSEGNIVILTSSKIFKFTNDDFEILINLQKDSSDITNISDLNSKLIYDEEYGFIYKGIYNLINFKNETFLNFELNKKFLKSKEKAKDMIKLSDNSVWFFTNNPNKNIKFYYFKNLTDTNYIEFTSNNSPFEDGKFEPFKVTTDNNGNYYFLVKKMIEGEFHPYILKFDKNLNWSKINIPDEFIPKGYISLISFDISKNNIMFIGTIQDGILKLNLNEYTDVEDIEKAGSGYDVWVKEAYPVPSSTSTMVYFWCAQSIKNNLLVNLFDIHGRKVKEIPELESYNNSTGWGTIKVDVEGLAPGLYYLFIKGTSSGRSVRIVVE